MVKHTKKILCTILISPQRNSYIVDLTTLNREGIIQIKICFLFAHRSHAVHSEVNSKQEEAYDVDQDEEEKKLPAKAKEDVKMKQEMTLICTDCEVMTKVEMRSIITRRNGGG